MSQVNDHLLLVVGPSSAGKSAALKNIRDQEDWLYLNCESGKRLPFKANFQQATVTDPLQVLEAFDHAETKATGKGLIVDTLTYMMDMYESQYVLGSANTMAAWGDFAQFFKNLMQDKVANSTKKVIFTAHTLASLNEAEMVYDVKVPIKGALKNQGIESYFSVIVAAKKIKVKDLKGFENALLVITEEEAEQGFKYVFQTRLTKETVNERIRGPIGMWERNETYIDNDVQLVLDRLDQYYA